MVLFEIENRERMNQVNIKSPREYRRITVETLVNAILAELHA
jgi:hypothetical protein